MSERKVCECAAQIAAMREAAELALDTVGNGGNVDVANALRDALSGDAGRALLERVEALERDLAEKSARCSRGAHAIIDLIGAHGPEHIDETCARASRRIEALERVVAEVRRMEASFLMVQPDLVQAMVALDALKEKR